MDKAGAFIRPKEDQLPLTCTDHYCILEGVGILYPDYGVAFSTPELPIIHFGEPKIWDYGRTGFGEMEILSCLTDNKWETNFNAGCGGFYQFNYSIEAGKELNDKEKLMQRVKTSNYPSIMIRL